MVRDVEQTFEETRDVFSKLLSDQKSVSITRRRMVDGKVAISKHRGVVSSLRISEGCIYIGIRGEEICIYDTSDAYADTVLNEIGILQYYTCCPDGGRYKKYR